MAKFRTCIYMHAQIRGIHVWHCVPGALLLRCAVVHCVDSRAERKTNSSNDTLRSRRFGAEAITDTANPRLFLCSALKCSPVPFATHCQIMHKKCEPGETIGYVAFRRVLYNMVKTHLYSWQHHLSDSENEDRILSKIVNMKKKFFGDYESTTSTEANQTKRRREREDADAVRNGVASDEQAARFDVRRSLALRKVDCSVLGRALATERQTFEESWAEDYAVGNTLLTQHLAASEEAYETSHASTREKHQRRAEAINCSTLAVRVFLWEEAEVIAQPLVDYILSLVGHSAYVYYVGAVMKPIGSYGYVREALASIIPPQKEQETRTPVITGHDGNVLDVTQVLDDLHFEVVHLYSSNQYCNIRMLETCVHRVLHDQPGRLWFGRGLGRFNNKICDVQRQIDQGSVSSLFLTFAPKKHLVEKEVRVRGNMPALRTFLND